MSHAFDYAWSVLKGNPLDRHGRPKKMSFYPREAYGAKQPPIPLGRDANPKGHPSTSFGQKDPSKTSESTASLRTGPTPPSPSEADESGFMELGEETEQEQGNVQDYDAEKIEQLRQLLGIE